MQRAAHFTCRQPIQISRFQSREPKFQLYFLLSLLNSLAQSGSESQSTCNLVYAHHRVLFLLLYWTGRHPTRMFFCIPAACPNVSHRRKKQSCESLPLKTKGSTKPRCREVLPLKKLPALDSNQSTDWRNPMYTQPSHSSHFCNT